MTQREDTQNFMRMHMLGTSPGGYENSMNIIVIMFKELQSSFLLSKIIAKYLQGISNIE